MLTAAMREREILEQPTLGLFLLLSHFPPVSVFIALTHANMSGRCLGYAG